MNIPRPQRAKAITDPARKAQLKQEVQPDFWAQIVVRTLEYTATFLVGLWLCGGFWLWLCGGGGVLS